MTHEIPLDILDTDDTDKLNCAVQRFSAKCKLSSNQSNTFTSQHRRWDCELLMDGESILETEFQCNMNSEPVAGEVWHCIAQDAMCYRESPDEADFLEELGYCGDAKSIREGLKAYAGCKKSAEALAERGISVHDLAMFLDNCENNGVNFAELTETEISR